MKLYRTTQGIRVEEGGSVFAVNTSDWDELIRTPGLGAQLREVCTAGEAMGALDPASLLAPIVSQEIWAAGVTYYRSRSARMEEAKNAGGGSFYDRVYTAERPELFFKATGARAIGPHGAVCIRADARWSVPEPELTLAINADAEIFGYTIGNDMSSRDIEGENPLYIPQAKVYDGSCALGPCLLISDEAMPKSTMFEMQIERRGVVEFEGDTTLEQMKREPTDLIEFLFRGATYPQGVFLMTGTGIVPKDEFTLAHGDVVRIAIEGIGTLVNRVA